MANLTKITPDEFWKKAESKTAIKRVIRLSDISELDTQNIGCHWTANKNYTHNGGGQNGFGKGGLIIEIYTSRPKEYNKIATSFSREGYPHEKEIVLCEGTTLNVMVIAITENGKRSFYKASGNSGNRVDSWVKNL